MATMITEECINCGACEPECPNVAIYQGGIEYEHQGSKHAALSNEIFYIVPEKCTECVGFYDHEACAAVCPVDCCIPNPNIVESEAVLLARARELHPDKTFGEDSPSRFKVAAGEAPTPSTAGNGSTPASPATAAAPAAITAPAAVKAPVRMGKVERKVTPLAQPTARATRFTGELPVSFEEVVGVVAAEGSTGSQGRLLRPALALAQPLLGALPAATKRRLEEAIRDPWIFSAAGSTGLNVLAHLVVLPLLALGYAVEGKGLSLYSMEVFPWFFWGFCVAALEATIRLRDAVIRARPYEEVVWRGSIYGPLLVPLVAPLLSRVQASRSVGQVAFEGYYESDGAYDEKTERERRYGQIYSLDERPSGYLFRLELPRRIPPSGVKVQLALGEEMPDYELDLALSGGWFQVHGKVVDERLRTVAATAPAFPPDFTTRVALGESCVGFAQRYRDKVLEVVLLKAGAAHRLARMADAA